MLHHKTVWEKPILQQESLSKLKGAHKYFKLTSTMIIVTKSIIIIKITFHSDNLALNILFKIKGEIITVSWKIQPIINSILLIIII